MILNTKQDYINFLEIDPQAAKEALKDLLDSRYAWCNKAVVVEDEDYTTDETHRIIGDDEKIYQAYEEDETAKLFRIGFTVNEVEELIK